MQPTTEMEDVKVTMQKLYAGPDGVARPGTVIDLPEPRAAEFKRDNAARDYNKDLDAEKPQGIQRYKADE